MLKRIVIACAIIAMASPALANRGGLRIEVKDLKDAATRRNISETISRSIRDLTGSQRLSTEVSRIITEYSSRLDTQTQTELTSTLNASFRGLEAMARNNPTTIQMSKVEDVISTNLSAAMAIKSNSIQNEKTQEIAELLFSFSGMRLKEKLENERVDYEFNIMQRPAEIVLAQAGRRSLNEREIDSLVAELREIFGVDHLSKVSRCRP